MKTQNLHIDVLSFIVIYQKGTSMKKQAEDELWMLFKSGT